MREESALLVRVRQALNASQAAAALDLISQHQLHFASGHLIQERDALEIQALAKLGRLAQVRARARDFLARYPESPYRETIAALIGNETNDD